MWKKVHTNKAIEQTQQIKTNQQNYTHMSVCAQYVLTGFVLQSFQDLSANLPWKN